MWIWYVQDNIQYRSYMNKCLKKSSIKWEYYHRLDTLCHDTPQLSAPYLLPQNRIRDHHNTSPLWYRGIASFSNTFYATLNYFCPSISWLILCRWMHNGTVPKLTTSPRLLLLNGIHDHHGTIPLAQRCLIT